MHPAPPRRHQLLRGPAWRAMAQRYGRWWQRARLATRASLIGALAAALPWATGSAGEAHALPVSEQIMVDQFGFRPHSTKLVLFASPQVGQNAGTTYTPPATATVRNLDNGQVGLSVALVPWGAGKVSPSAGDKVWYADISALQAPGTYAIEDGENHVRSYPFRIAADVYAPVLKAAVRMYFYQRCGGEVPAANGGAAWHHAACHLSEGQDRAAQLYIDGQAKGMPRMSMAAGTTPATTTSTCPSPAR